MGSGRLLILVYTIAVYAELILWLLLLVVVVVLDLYPVGAFLKL
jgi:hypothetical protein